MFPRRIYREVEDLAESNKTQNSNIYVEVADDTLMNIRGQIGGPSGTPYEGGIFHLGIQLPERHPFEPPKVKFLSKIWHPNISSATGAIYLDILQDNWSGFMSLRYLLVSIQALLDEAEPDHPQDEIVVRQYRNNYPLFCKTAQHWTFMHAGGEKSEAEFTKKIQTLKDMGVSEIRALIALSSCNWDMNQAIEEIFP